MKSTNTLLALFICAVNMSFAQEWFKTDLTDFASIEFPVESEVMETNGETFYAAQDELAYYIVSLRELTHQQSSQISPNDISELYNGVVQGALDATNGEVVSVDEITVQKMPALELEYTVQNNLDLPTQRFKRIIYVNQHIISIDFWPLTNQKDVMHEIKTKFFGSFSFQSKDVDNTSKDTTGLNEVGNDDHAYKMGHQLGYIIGIITFLLLLLAVGVGLFFLIRYLVKKKKKKKHINQPVTHQAPKPSVIICDKCDAENNFDAKYCKRCGFELKNQTTNTFL